MSAFFTPVASRAALAASVLIAAGMTGCLRWPPGRSARVSLENLDAAEQAETPSKPAGADPPAPLATPPDRRAVLGSDGWIRAPQTPGAAGDEPAFRWRHPDLDDLLARPAGRCPDLRPELSDADPIVAANAAIGLARQGDASGMEQLARAVRTPKLKLPIRLAAAEALASLDRPPPVSSLRELVDQYGGGSRDGAAHPIPELHAELIRGLARHVDPADDRRFVEALRSPAAEVRREAVDAWSAAPGGDWPLEVIDLRTDPDPRVRAAVLGFLARRHHPQAQQYLAAALDDHELRVRIAAVTAMGELGTGEARQTLEGLLDDRAELIRAAAVSALATLGAEGAVGRAAGDKSWRVRLAVAEALDRWPNRNTAGLARQLLDDPSTMVRQQMFASISRWPLRQAGPILLAALGKTGYLTRQTAARQLAARWPPAADFTVDAPPERRAEVLQQLERRFRDQIGFVDREALAAAAETGAAPPVAADSIARAETLVRQLSEPGLAASVRRQAVAALAGFGPGLIEALEVLALDRQQALPEAIYREVLPDYGPEFAALDRLASGDVSVRRRAAGALAELTGERPLRRLAVSRLASLAATEMDPLVWQGVLTAVAADPSEPAVRLACAAVSHPSPEVRRRGCEHLAAHPDPRHAKVLLPALDDPSDAVARAAVRALGAAGRIDDTGPLERLLASTSELLRVEAATALCRLGDPSGPAALERLAYNTNPAIRREAAAAMGRIAEPAFTPTLIHLLDDQQSVRREALKSLPKVVGRDVAEAAEPSTPNSTRRVELWKKWFQQPQDSVGRRPPPIKF